MIGYAPNDYGPEVWVVEYRMEQEQIATRGDYWQTRIQRRASRSSSSGKACSSHDCGKPLPSSAKGSTFAELVQGNDPNITHLGSAERALPKVLENIYKGQAQKAAPIDSADFYARCAAFDSRR